MKNINNHPFRNRPIPIISKEFRNKVLSFPEIPIDKNNQLYNETYLDIKEIGLSGDNYYFRKNNPPYFKSIKGAINNLLLRKTVAEKLLIVNKKLKEYGVELYFFDCYRPVDVQSFFYNEWYPVFIKKLYPNLSEKEILEMRDKFTAKPYKSFDDINPSAPPPHSTGGASDLTIRFLDNKQHLFMGTIFDEASPLSNTCYFEIKIEKGEQLTLSEIEALKNRRLLYWSLKEFGFENFPNEWWHYSYGDQMWALLSKNKIAYYSKLKIYK